MKTVIVIPARYASTRLPGKPLAKILGKEMLLRVWEVAQIVVKNTKDVSAVVATDDKRITDFCDANNINYVMTSVECKTGTDRVMETISKMEEKPDFVVNMQGDNPLCPPWFVQSIIEEFQKDPSIQVATPMVNLKWKDLDTLRKNKETTPFSGTCVTFDKNKDALYFSKNIIPAIKKEEKLRETEEFSPVYRHPGLYGYSLETLNNLNNLEFGDIEDHESLEQLRFLENGVKVRMVQVDYRDREEIASMSGVDAPEDLARAEKLFEKYGEYK